MGVFGLLFLAFSSTLLLLFNLSTAQYRVAKLCLGGNYTTNSTYEANLSILLTSMSNNSTNPNNARFFTSTVGSNSDGIYGLFQCRGDCTSESCKKCAKTATEEVTSRCPFKKETVLYYDECLLHYSDKPFVSNLHLDPTVHMVNDACITANVNQFTRTLSALMEGIVARAVFNSSNLFAVGETYFTSSVNIYGLVQCTQDLSPYDCRRCLYSSIFQLSCCDTRQGGRVVNPSCIIRFEIYNFFGPEAIISAPAPPQITAPPNTNTTNPRQTNSSKRVVIIVVSTVTTVILIATVAISYSLRRRKIDGDVTQMRNGVDEISNVESLQFNFGTIREATDNFSDANKLGQGGFGSVYKLKFTQGRLLDGREIAVKRLSRNSDQGVTEFKNEALLVVKLQHRNLVKLLGFCLEEDEKLLIYEFVPNASLDHFIFGLARNFLINYFSLSSLDPIKCTYLDWERRYQIIGGIARGLLYLHEDSRHRIVHRDLKAGNILLDAKMIPKIADFGMARLFVMDQTEDSTNRIVGTYGYMAPEYAMHGQFSVKSDVFSFGVLILEIISGQKNNCFFQSEHAENLLSYAWKHREGGTALKLIEPALKEQYSRTDAMRCIHIGLLCVQEDIALRPTMAAVVSMLNSNSVTLPLPSTPAFFVNSREPLSTGDNAGHTDQPLQPFLPDQSINEVSVTEIYPR
ncbi:hypothetical protein IFM89_025686 [Coptis chinensis]|uniref:Uncharacterized protein n=1 Tax=Coptis chinensis TaxID=261450 RepID=A0A835GZS9_9MAGN|nr:hypothetical protein IFM89_025686 [Coptis chinensis]